MDFVLKTNDQEEFKFNSKADILTFLEKEIEYWTSFISSKEISFNKGQHNHPWNQIRSDTTNKQLGPLNNCKSNVRDSDDPQRISSYLSTLQISGVVLSSSKRGERINDLLQTEPDTAFFLLTAWNPQACIESYIFHAINNQGGTPQNKNLFSSYIKALTESQFFEKGFKKTAYSEKKVLTDIANESRENLKEIEQLKISAEEKIGDIDAQLNTTVQKLESVLQNKTKFSKNLIKKQIVELRSLRKLYTEELALKIPVTYWQEKAKDHRLAAFSWGAAFIIVAALAIFFSPAAIKHIIEGAREIIPEIEKNTVSFFFIISFPAFLCIWTLRMLSKNALINFEQMYDAKNRATMTNTFLALMSEGKANENDRILILGTLFQPTKSHTDDGAPPHWFEMIAEKIKT